MLIKKQQNCFGQMRFFCRIWWSVLPFSSAPNLLDYVEFPKRRIIDYVHAITPATGLIAYFIRISKITTFKIVVDDWLLNADDLDTELRYALGHLV